jgi:prophage regulatory protein
MPNIIRKSQLKTVTGLSPRQVDRLEKAGKFPKRLQLGQRAVGWHENEIIAWLEERPRGPSSPPQDQVQ